MTTNDLDVARAALRDGLWEVARTHAQKAPGDTAKLIILETYAHEENWKGLLAAYDAMGYPTGDGFAYYRTLALFRDGSPTAASNVLAGASITNAAFARPAARLRAELLLAAGQRKEALALLEKEGGDTIETQMMKATIFSQEGNAKAADRIWRAVTADPHAPERARATAAVGLEDVKTLRALATSAHQKNTRRVASLNLGLLLIKGPTTFAEGAKRIEEVVHDSPDAPGAKAAFLALAHARLSHNDFAAAKDTYSNALQIWPDLVHDASTHVGLGWALQGLGQLTDALEAFRQGEALETDPERKATAAVKVADILAAMGRDQEATAAYQKVQRDYPNTSVSERVARVIRLREDMERGLGLYRDTKFSEARKAFSALAGKDPAHAELLAFYGALCAYGAGDDDTAEREVRLLAEGAKDAAVRARATLWLAKFSFNRERWQEAENLFAAAAERAPQSSDVPQALLWSARAALANNDFHLVISNVARLVSQDTTSAVSAEGLLVQGEALVELGRFDEAALVFDRAARVKGATDATRQSASIKKADMLFAMGADNPSCYEAARAAYEALRAHATLTPDERLTIAFKTARTLEKLKRLDEALDVYYTQVVLAYRTGRLAGTHYEEDARATFARAAFRLADEYENRGRIRQALHVLDLVRTSDARAADEAAKRMDKLNKKGVL